MSLPGSDFGSIARDGLRLPTPYEAPIGESETAIAEIFAEIGFLEPLRDRHADGVHLP